MDNIKDRIRKLLNLAENDAASAGEVENALRFADRLMSEHNLSKADVGEHGAAVVEERMARDHAFCGSEKHALWEGRLASFVADLVGGVYVYSDHPDRIRSPAGLTMFGPDGRAVMAARYCFYGDAESVAVAVRTFSDLRRTVASMARLKFGTVFKGDGRAYCEGFTRGLRERMDEDRAAERAGKGEAGQTGAIVLATQRATLDKWHAETKDKALGWLKSEFGIKLSTSSRRGNANDAGAFGAGRNDGRSTSVSGARSAKLSGGACRSLPGR